MLDDGMSYAEALIRWGELSGGERKRLVLDVLFDSAADILLLDEPDNYLDIPMDALIDPSGIARVRLAKSLN